MKRVAAELIGLLIIGIANGHADSVGTDYFSSGGDAPGTSSAGPPPFVPGQPSQFVPWGAPFPYKGCASGMAQCYRGGMVNCKVTCIGSGASESNSTRSTPPAPQGCVNALGQWIANGLCTPAKANPAASDGNYIKRGIYNVYHKTLNGGYQALPHSADVQITPMLPGSYNVKMSTGQQIIRYKGWVATPLGERAYVYSYGSPPRYVTFMQADQSHLPPDMEAWYSVVWKDTANLDGTGREEYFGIPARGQ